MQIVNNMQLQVQFIGLLMCALFITIWQLLTLPDFCVSRASC